MVKSFGFLKRFLVASVGIKATSECGVVSVFGEITPSSSLHYAR
jgi:hypothetical protein